MIYDKALVLSKQKAMMKSITDLLDVLSDIEIGDGGNSGEIVLDDGSVMTLSAAANKESNLLNVEKVSVTNARLNLDILISKTMPSVLSQDDSVIRLVKKKSSSDDKIIFVKKKP